jgi:Fe-S cluster assembly ATP-binding protein
MFKITNLKVKASDVHILKGVDLTVEEGSTTVLMGPPFYEVTDGAVMLSDVNILELDANLRSEAGIFLSFQYPSEVPGVNVANYLRMIFNLHHKQNLSPVKFRALLKEKMDFLEMSDDFTNRFLNEGFSGGEKKRMEMLQLLVIEPKLAILDETDSGLDVDALKLVGKTINHLKEKNNMSVLLITHYTRILKYIHADKVYIMQDGHILRSGDASLAHELEEKGFK